MCEQCEEDAERLRPVVDAIIASEVAARRVHAHHSQGQHAVRLASTILSSHEDNRGYMTQDAVKSIAFEYAIVVQRLIALQEMSGISPP
jgi:hypothetical protein